MNLTREQVLAEMGITPIWRPRAAAPAGLPGEQVAAVPVATAAPVTIFMSFLRTFVKNVLSSTESKSTPVSRLPCTQAVSVPPSTVFAGMLDRE